jgi:hypothetical protein
MQSGSLLSAFLRNMLYLSKNRITLVNKDFVPRGKISVSDVFLDT